MPKTRSPLRSRLALCSLAALALSVPVGCGDDAEDNPKTLLDTAASKKLDSAEVDLRSNANIPGFPILGSRLTMTARGPFVANGPDSLPTFDWRVMLRAGGQTFPARVSGLDGGIYVEFMGQFYEADRELIEQMGLDGKAGRPAPTSLSQLGLNPDQWLTRVKVSDGDDIGDDSTRVVTGAVNKRAVLEDLLSIIDLDQLEDAGDGVKGLPDITDESIDEAVEAIGKVDVEVNIDEDDNPRRVYAELDFTVPESVKDTAIENGTVVFELKLDDIGEATVDVEPPFDPDPLSSLLSFAGVIFGVDELSDLWRKP